MSTSECELLLSKLIDILIKYENQIEDVRILLAKNNYFLPSFAFKRIVNDKKGYLVEADLESFLRHYGLTTGEKELKRFFISDQQKSNILSYNNFLDQVLPTNDLELRTKCLDRKNKEIETTNEVLLADVDRMITSIYQKEIELFRALKGNINRFIEFDIEMIDFVFSMLADDNSGYLSFKSILSFMKKNGYTFDKRGFESLMRRIDKKAKGRISHVELKFFLLSNEAFQEPNQSFSYHERTHNHSKSIFDNLSPIKSSKASPQKNNVTANEIRIPSHENANKRAESKSPAKRTRNERSPEIRIPEEPLRTFSTNYEQPVQTNASYEERFNNKSKSLNQSRAETNYARDNTRNPMEMRYLDPVYNNYWSPNRDHNKTLSPEYFNKIKGQNLLDTFRKNTFATGRTNPYFNPGLVEQSACENFQRFPFNPFRYTDHEHYFQGYYGNLRNNYYDRYYHHTPYSAKIDPLAKTEHSKMSPIKIKTGVPREFKFAGSHRRFDSGVSIPPSDQLALYQHFQGSQPNFYKKSTNTEYDLRNPLDERLQSLQEQQPSAYRPEIHRAEKLTLDDFLYQGVGQRSAQNQELPRNPQPYTYVVRNA